MGMPICSAFNARLPGKRVWSMRGITAIRRNRSGASFFARAPPTTPCSWTGKVSRSRPDRSAGDADHGAFCGLDDPVVHRRRVLFIKPRYWIVVDDVVGISRHQVDLLFQFAPMRVTLGPDLWAGARTAAGPVLWVGPFASASLRG